MRRCRFLICLYLLAVAASLPAQAPRLLAPSPIPYPPIAKAAHVSGEAIVRFSIADDGTISIESTSGPALLSASLAAHIASWRFATPLLPGTEHHWTATYRYTLSNGEEYEASLEDRDTPPYVPCCGDMTALSASDFTVSGEVRSGNQTLDLNAPPPTVVDRCPEDHQRTPPATTDSHDFVELERMSCDETCRNYRVRVNRGGLVTWRGRQGVKETGDRQGTVSSGDADTLLERFQAKEFWTACSVNRPEPEQDPDAENFRRSDFLTVSLGGVTKTIDGSADGSRLAWIVDRISNTHTWRHGDAATEPLMNMDEDLKHPKAGVTPLMRATQYFNPVTARLSLAPLKRLIANGADLNAADESGWTALMYAAALYSDLTAETPVKLLLAGGASPNRRSLQGETALMAAAYRGNLDDDLLKAGADINARNSDGVTTLMFLAQHADADTLAEALLHGADANAADIHGRTALEYLREASCDRAIVSLPVPWMVLGTDKPKPCPANSQEYRESEALLKAAMKKSAH